MVNGQVFRIITWQPTPPQSKGISLSTTWDALSSSVGLSAQGTFTSSDCGCDKMKNKKYHTLGKAPKSNEQIVERGKIYPLKIQILDRLPALFWAGISIKRGAVKLVLGTQTTPLSEIVLFTVMWVKCQLSRYYKERCMAIFQFVIATPLITLFISGNFSYA